MDYHRFSYVPRLFVPKIKILDILQLSAGEPPDTKKWENWHWTSDESAFVTDIRTRTEAFWTQMEDKKNCPPEVKDEMKVAIRDFMVFDHGESQPHNLLNKIADFGTLKDCDTLGIKRGTPLAKKASEDKPSVLDESIAPVLGLRLNEIGKHTLTVVNPATPYSKALPPGMSAARIFRYIGTVAPTRPSQFESIGNAKRGLFKSNLEGVEPQSDKLYAWYIARYEDTRGITGDASNQLKLEIYFQVL